MIGYGPDISDDKTVKNKSNDDPDLHPLPPPITKGTTTGLHIGE